MGRWIFSARIMAASAAVLSVALTFWLTDPAVADFLAAGVPRMYRSVASWLTPPYLDLIINGIIISIAATSRYQKTVEDADFRADVLDPRGSGDEIMNLSVKAGLEEEFVISSSRCSPKRRENKDPPEKSTGNGLVVDKPLASTRLSHRRSIKTSPEVVKGKALGVARSRKSETLESTWRTLTEGRAVPLARHLKKSDTWAIHSRATASETTMPAGIHEIQKFESFTTRSSAVAASQPHSSDGGYSPPVAKLRREPSLGQDDLNRRVEAFIRNFNEEMQLQRQESLKKYRDMIKRGSH